MRPLWLGYAYYNNGVTYGGFDKKYTYPAGASLIGSDPIKDATTGNGEAGFVAKQGVNVNDANGTTQINLIDNKFKMPKPGEPVWHLIIKRTTNGNSLSKGYTPK